MATNAKERRKRGLWIIVALIAAAALCLLAMAAGWISSPLFDSMFGRNNSSQSSGGGSGGGSGGSGAGCFLNIICLNGSADDSGVDAAATIQP